MRIIDFDNWNRKEHFNFFSSFDNPFFGIVTDIDCTKAYKNAKKENKSFFAYYLHKSILAANNVDEFKLRIVNNKVVMFDKIHAAATIGRKDGTFGFSFMDFNPDFKIFQLALKQEINIIQKTSGLRANENSRRQDVIRYSTLPWNKFTGLTHPSNLKTDDSVPKITFGKAFMSDNKRKLPISIEAHHGLADGIHLAHFLEEFQKLMND